MLLDCIAEDINEVGQGREVIIMGDLNAHIEDFDGHTDMAGQEILKCYDLVGLIIVKGQDKCEKKRSRSDKRRHLPLIPEIIFFFALSTYNTLVGRIPCSSTDRKA